MSDDPKDVVHWPFIELGTVPYKSYERLPLKIDMGPSVELKDDGTVLVDDEPVDPSGASGQHLDGSPS